MYNQQDQTTINDHLYLFILFAYGHWTQRKRKQRNVRERERRDETFVYLLWRDVHRIQIHNVRQSHMSLISVHWHFLATLEQ